MKKVFIVLLVSAGFLACKTGDKKVTVTDPVKDSLAKLAADSATKAAILADTANNTSIQWLDSTFIDLGKQKEGKEIEITYRFKNIGSKTLIIQNVTAQCGCTIPEKPEQPFAPGEEGKIKAKFNGSGHGETRKEVYVSANTSPVQHTLVFRAELVK